MTLWTAYLLGVSTTFLVLIVAWIILRIAEPWVMARAAAVPVGFLHIVGMRLRKTDPRVVVAALVVLAKSDQPISPFKLEAIYMTLPERERDVDDLLRAARHSVSPAGPGITDGLPNVALKLAIGANARGFWTVPSAAESPYIERCRFFAPLAA